MQNYILFDEIYNACFLFCPINLYQAKIGWKTHATLIGANIVTDHYLKTTLANALKYEQ